MFDTSFGLWKSPNVKTLALQLLFLLLVLPPALHGQIKFLRGDANDDGRVSIADAHYISLWLYGGGPPPPCIKAADANDDGKVGLGGLDGDYRNDVFTIVSAVTCKDLNRNGCFDHAPLAPPRDAPGDDPTPDDLSCDSYTGSAQPVSDPGAKLEVLEAKCPGGGSSLAILKVRISCSRSIGGYSGVIDGLGLFDEVLANVDVGQMWIRTQHPVVVSENQIVFGCLEADNLGRGRPEHLNLGILPPQKDQVVLKIYLRLAQGTPAGVYPIVLLDGEMADSLSGQAIFPTLVDGSLTVEEDVAPNATADVSAGPHWECTARETLPPSGPEDVQVSFEMMNVPAERGSRVVVPFWIQANASLEGFSFALNYGNFGFDGKLQLVAVESVQPEGKPWEVFEYKIHPKKPTVWGEAIFSRTDPAAFLPPGMLHQVLRLEFEVDASVPDGLATIMPLDIFGEPEIPGNGDWPNAVRAFGQLLHQGVVTCFELLYRRGGIIVGSVSKTPFVRGDANADGVVSFADAVLIGRSALRGDQQIPCEDAADADDSGSVDLSDAIRIFKHLFGPPSNATAIPPPFPGRGLDKTLDPLPCEQYQVVPAAASDDSIRIGPIDVAPGEQVEVPIYMTVSKPLAAYQLVVRYDPEVLTPTLDEVDLGGSVFEGITLFINSAPRDFVPGHIAVAFAPDLMRQNPVPAGRDLLVGKIAGFVSDIVQPGDEIILEPVAFAEGDVPRPDRLRTEIVEVEDGRLVTLLPALEAGVLRVVDPDEATFIRGDSNSDLLVNISDAIFTLSYLFLGGAAPSCQDAADANDSGKVELTDAVVTLNYLFSPGGRTLAPPFPEMGRDLQPDELPSCRNPLR